MSESNEYSQGVCEDGAVILRNGEVMTIEEIISALKELEALRAEVFTIAEHLSNANCFMGETFEKDPTEYTFSGNRIWHMQQALKIARQLTPPEGGE